MRDNVTSLPRSRLRGVVYAPEVNLLIFAFLLNFAWEFLQTPFFEFIPRLPHWDAVKLCTVATIGDAAIMLTAFWCVAAAAKTREWILNARWGHFVGFVAVGLAITIVLERFAQSTGRWAYAEAMPVVPLLGIGVVPLLQWMVLPLLTAWFTRRQLT